MIISNPNRYTALRINSSVVPSMAICKGRENSLLLQYIEKLPHIRYNIIETVRDKNPCMEDEKK